MSHKILFDTLLALCFYRNSMHRHGPKSQCPIPHIASRTRLSPRLDPTRNPAPGASTGAASRSQRRRRPATTPGGQNQRARDSRRGCRAQAIKRFGKCSQCCPFYAGNCGTLLALFAFGMLKKGQICLKHYGIHFIRTHFFS